MVGWRRNHYYTIVAKRHICFQSCFKKKLMLFNLTVKLSVNLLPKKPRLSFSSICPLPLMLLSSLSHCLTLGFSLVCLREMFTLWGFNPWRSLWARAGIWEAWKVFQRYTQHSERNVLSLFFFYCLSPFLTPPRYYVGRHYQSLKNFNAQRLLKRKFMMIGSYFTPESKLILCLMNIKHIFGTIKFKAVFNN